MADVLQRSGSTMATVKTMDDPELKTAMLHMATSGANKDESVLVGEFFSTFKNVVFKDDDQ